MNTRVIVAFIVSLPLWWVWAVRTTAMDETALVSSPSPVTASAILARGLVAELPPDTGTPGKTPEESLLSGHGITVTAAGLRDFMKSLRERSVERPELIRRLIIQLGSEEFSQREAASAKLVALPIVPVKELTAALDAPDAEIRRRAGKILEQVGDRAPPSALLFAALLLIRDREFQGLAGEVLLLVPLCDAQPMRAAAKQAMRATVCPTDRALLDGALASDNIQVRATAAAGLVVIGATAERRRDVPVTWVEFFDTYLVQGRYDGERTEFLKSIPASLAMHFERVTRTANTIDAVVNRHGTSPWLYPVRGKNEIPRALVEAGKKQYPIHGTWRQHWKQWIVLDENGVTIDGGPAQAPHIESRVDFLIVPISTPTNSRQP